MIHKSLFGNGLRHTIHRHAVFLLSCIPASSTLATHATLPEWLKIRPPSGERYRKLRSLVDGLRLTTVCEEARCPNLSECWSGGTATFMLLGETCTRGCSFCSVKTARRGEPVDVEEPQKVLEAVQQMELRYIVLTSVDRDDLEDQGAAHFARTVAHVKAHVPGLRIETLIPDFRADEAALATVASSGADVLAHNVETVRRLTPSVRDPRATYDQSLRVLGRLKQLRPEALTKTSIMLGHGESELELVETFRDLRAVGVELLTLGQYLRPTEKHRPVAEFVHPDRFETLGRLALENGFLHVASGPFVRSSYKAGELFTESLLRARAQPGAARFGAFQSTLPLAPGATA
ncbi:MAG: lipoyl synthase [Planctomycetes bacterium]|nr:lipoyl synthase [Planctomycetota bacterium]